jgi:hypothetical protein
MTDMAASRVEQRALAESGRRGRQRERALALLLQALQK